MKHAPSTINRRQLIQASAAGLAAAAAGCTNSPVNRLKVFNWSDYIQKDLIPEFEAETGATVLYDNYAADAELEARLASGGGSYDVVFPSDRSMPALLHKGLLAEIDKSQITGFKHLDAKFLSPPFDPENRYSVPYFWGTVAVGYRSDQVQQAVRGFEVLFDERLKGRITMLDDAENVVAAVLVHLGLPLNSIEPEHLARAQKLLVRQRPLVKAYTSDAYKELLIAGQAWASLGWSGDLRQAADEEPQVKVVVPESGTMMWVDSMAIPKAAENALLAHKFIDFLLRPEVAARNAQAVKFATPNVAARDKLPPEMRDDPTIYPPKEILDRCEWLKNRGDDIARVEAVWRVVQSS